MMSGVRYPREEEGTNSPGEAPTPTFSILKCSSTLAPAKATAMRWDHTVLVDARS